MARVVRAGKAAGGGTAPAPAATAAAAPEGSPAAPQDAADAIVARARLEAAAIREAARAEARQEVLVLAVAVARRLLAAELALAPERIEGVVEAVLARSRGATDLRLRVHPDDAAALAAALQAGRLRVDALVPDPTLERGGCLLVGSGGEVDGRVAVRLEAFLAALREADAG